jgi:hypothetical protein
MKFRGCSTTLTLHLGNTSASGNGESTPLSTRYIVQPRQDALPAPFHPHTTMPASVSFQDIKVPAPGLGYVPTLTVDQS